MEVKIYKRRTDVTNHVDEAINSTGIVELDRSDYGLEPIVREVDFESRIIFGEEIIMADIQKVLGIIDLELWVHEHMDLIVNGDLVEFNGDLYMKTPKQFVQIVFRKK